MTPISQAAESLSDRYRIQRELGAGGMATVYLAHDVRHDRDVAVKIVKPEIVAAVGADRFINEIRTTAHLRHPHVLPLFDSGRAGEALYYVMPFVDGESLRARLRREQQLPLKDAVRILREVADALAYAHGRGIVHCDLKPDNVLLSGHHAFLSDFGVACALQAGGRHDETMTMVSTMVGTPMYMSPEQAEGRSRLDHRSDIYALGVMAYEMVAGEPPFTGSSAPVVLAAHLTASAEPLSVRRPDVPQALAALVLKCLAKKPENRWQRMDDLLPVLDDIAVSLRDGLPATSHRRAASRTLAAGLFTIIAAATIGWLLLNARPGKPLSVVALTHLTRDSGVELDPAISPDGRMLAFVAGPAGKRRIYVRQIDGGRAVALTDAGVADSQRRPDWSPDGSRIVFQAGQQGIGVRPEARNAALYVVPALGGTPAVLVPPRGEGYAVTPVWSPDGTQVAFCSEGGIYVIPASGGSPRPILKTSASTHSVRWSPDGSRLAYVSGGIYFALGEDQLGNTETSSIHLVTIADGAARAVTSGSALDTSPVWTADGRALLFISSRAGGRDVFRQRLSRTGEPEGEADRITSGSNAHSISTSRDGKLLAYSSLTFRANVWSLPVPVGDVVSAAAAQPLTSGSEKTEKIVTSHDGAWLAFDSDRSGNADVWKIRLDGGEPEQVTRDPANEFANDWSPDAREILYHAIRPGTRRDLLAISVDGTRVSVIAGTDVDEQHGSWSPDGNSVVFARGAAAPDTYKLFVTSRADRNSAWGVPRPLTSGTGVDPRWSPDGRSIVFTHGGEVRIVSPDGTEERLLVPRSSGQPAAQYAVWSRDSRTVYFKAADEQRQATIWAVDAEGGTPRLLVRFDDAARPSLRREFATDGVRFFFTIAQDESDIWIAEVR